ncbi:MAG: histidine phosphatase family protein [Burkholderiaceae bacterium]
MSATSLLLIRHGETAWNAEHRIQGHLDIPLSPTGVQQAVRLAARLSGEPIDAVYASDLDRAASTAAPLAERLGLAVHADVRLRERSFGLLQGLTLQEIAERHPAQFAHWRQRDIDWTPPGGESAREFIDRVLLGISVVAEAGHRCAVVVTHGGVLDVVYRSAHAMSWDAPRGHVMLNASINRLQASAPPLRLSVLDWCDAAHLDLARDEFLT